MGAVEREIRALMRDLEQELVREEMERFDVDVPVLTIDGVVHRRAIRAQAPYEGLAGTMRVERTLYRPSAQEPCVCPMEMRAGMIEGFTPEAAKLAVAVVAQMTPAAAEDLFERVGGMTPSKSTLDRLPKRISETWEEQRESIEKALREAEEIPKEAVSVAISLDGVMVPMKDGQRQEKREQAREEGRTPSGPSGFNEVGCGTLSFYDQEGKMLRTVRMARMPEPGKKSLKAWLKAELEEVLRRRPDLILVRVADGAEDNWRFLDLWKDVGPAAVDFFHAAEHLSSAMEAVHGEGTAKQRAELEKYRSLLRHDVHGVEKVIRHLEYLRVRHPQSKKLNRELKYFRKRRQRMRYASLAERNLPIGSGVIEAACKTLATQRLKCSGMRWRTRGGQGILTFRGLLQSDRFDRAWALLRRAYVATVEVPENVVALDQRRRLTS